LDGIWHWDADQVKRLLGALQFLTVAPIHELTASPGESAVFFPIVGALLGVSGGAVLWLASATLGRSLGALLALAWLMAATGCLHEDGLADVADAVRAGRTREKMLEILKDSRIGTYGAVALIVSIAVRWQALAQTRVNPVAGLVAALALSRASLVGLAATAPPAGTGMGRAFAADCSSTALSLVAVQTIALLGLCSIFMDWRYTLEMLAASVVTTLVARVYFLRRLGGVNGDCLGATCQVVEAVNLVILAWQPST
jgi:adenosylcobinamide-GDP ribazoletransferase